MNTVQENVNVDTQNDEIEEVEPLEEGEDDVEAIKAYNAKITEQNKQLFARAKKAEGFVKDKDGKWVRETKPVVATTETKKEATIVADTSKLSQKDLLTIARAEIEDEDIDDVVEYATLKKISVADALKSTIMKAILADKAEARKVAAGTSTGKTRRSNVAVSDEALMEKAAKGELPESDDDIRRLATLSLKKNK